MIHSGKFSDKEILIVDKEQKNKNDRTWCFWEKEAGLFEPIVYKRWEKLWFHGNDFSRQLEIEPYQYKLIRGIDFYNFCLDTISKHKNFSVEKGQVMDMGHLYGKPSVRVVDQPISAEYVFNSVILREPKLKKKEYYLLQHFKGWFIETEKPFFDPGKATLMDFRVDQTEGTSFVYVMPFSATEALVEYTLFSEKLLDDKQYDIALKDYIERVLKTGSYKIKENEFGVIPMTNHKFPVNDGSIINIGTAGGQTKGSSGYTFRFIQKHSAAIVQQLISGKSPVVKPSKKKFHFYDSVLLNILHHKKISGDKIFSSLFKKNKPQRLLRFLDNESLMNDDLKIISSLPTWPFLKAAMKQL